MTKALSDIRVVLASASPRRHELLTRLVLLFDVIPARIDEDIDGPPEEQVTELAQTKSRAVAAHEAGLIIGADTLVAMGDRIFGKPTDEEDARAMLRALSGRDHRVLTGLCVVDTSSGCEVMACETTVVSIRSIDPRELDAYVASGEPMDKAGAYAIQGRGGLFVQRICGDYYNVVGLPLCRLSLMLRELGFVV